MLKFLGLCTVLALTRAIPQYPPSGWRPKGIPFVLPREYLPSSPFKNAVQREMLREQLEYVEQYEEQEPFFKSKSAIQQPQIFLQKQLDESSTNLFNIGKETQSQQPQLESESQLHHRPHTAYQTPLPEIPKTTEEITEDNLFMTEVSTTQIPTTENYLKVQGLPALQRNIKFRKVAPLNLITESASVKMGQLTQETQFNEGNILSSSKQQSPKGQIGFVNTHSGKLSKETVLPVNSNGIPEISINLKPSNSYGPPQKNDESENEQSLESPKRNTENENSENENNEDNDDLDVKNEAPTTNIAISNAVNTNGQYYILSPDNMLQKVIFMTMPNAKDAGFTAQLRYMPVEPIRDPIYAYNEKGQLIRIFRK